MAHRRESLLIVHHVQKRCVIFINDYDGFLAGLLHRPVDKPFETLVDTNLTISFAVELFVFQQFDVQFAEQFLLVAMLRRGHVEVQHRMLCPFFLQFPSFQAVEQILVSLEVTMERG